MQVLTMYGCRDQRGRLLAKVGDIIQWEDFSGNIIEAEIYEMDSNVAYARLCQDRLSDLIDPKGYVLEL